MGQDGVDMGPPGNISMGELASRRSPPPSCGWAGKGLRAMGRQSPLCYLTSRATPNTEETAYRLSTQVGNYFCDVGKKQLRGSWRPTMDSPDFEETTSRSLLSACLASSVPLQWQGAIQRAHAKVAGTLEAR